MEADRRIKTPLNSRIFCCRLRHRLEYCNKRHLSTKNCDKKNLGEIYKPAEEVIEAIETAEKMREFILKKLGL